MRQLTRDSIGTMQNKLRQVLRLEGEANGFLVVAVVKHKITKRQLMFAIDRYEKCLKILKSLVASDKE